MMRNLLFLVVMLVTIPALAQMSKEEQLFWEQNLLGWDGIAARCHGPPFPHVDLICEAVVQEVDFLTATAKIPFVYTGRSNQFTHRRKAHKAGIKNAIDLDIRAHASRGDFIGIYGQLSAGSFYIDAVETGAKKNKPEHRPKSGEFVIWDRRAISQGPVDEVSNDIADTLKGFAKEFITLYIKYRKPIE